MEEWKRKWKLKCSVGFGVRGGPASQTLGRGVLEMGLVERINTYRILGLYWENGKENGSCYLGFRV